MPFEPIKPAPSRGFTPSRPQQRPTGGGMVNTSINAGGVKLDNPAAQANIAGRKAAATAAANAAVKKRMDDNRSKAVQKAISDTPGNTGLQEIGQAVRQLPLTTQCHIQHRDI